MWNLVSRFDFDRKFPSLNLNIQVVLMMPFIYLAPFGFQNPKRTNAIYEFLSSVFYSGGCHIINVLLTNPMLSLSCKCIGMSAHCS